MIIDRLNTFCWQTALNTGGAASYLLGDQIDIEDLRDLGLAEIWLIIMMTTSADSANDTATAVFSLCSDAQAAIAVNGTQTVHMTTGAAKAVPELTAGTVLLKARIPLEGPTYERYLGIVQTTAVQAFSAGAVSAFFVTDPSAIKHYPNAIQ
jgi:hypothetical protein